MKLASKLWSFVIVATLLGLAGVTQPTRAAGPWYVATTGNDSNDCLSPATPCATINGAIGKATAGDTIYVAIGTYVGSGVEVVLINKNVTLSGGWDSGFVARSGLTTIDGEVIRRGLTVNTSVTALIEYVVVQNGLHAGDFMSPPESSGVHNAGVLTFNNSIVNGNLYSYGIGAGGISNSGSLTLNNTLVSNNSGYVANSGGLYNNGGTITLNNSNVSSNIGFGIDNEGGSLTLNNSSVTGHQYAGVANYGGNVTLNSSTITGNVGGIYTTSTLTLNNSTVSDNTSPYSGAGISNFGGTITINSSTITGNSSTEDGSGIDNLYGGTINLQNTILAANGGPSSTDCRGTIVSSGYNLIGNSLGCNLTLVNGDITNVDPKLGPLQNNGGSTLTHALQSNSPAINAGNPNGCTGSKGLLTTDQRGAQRLGRCDIGAYESNLLATKIARGIFKPSGLVTYTITLNNSVGGTDLTGVFLTDTLPILITYIPNSLSVSNGAASESNGVITWNGTVLSNTETVIAFSAAISSTAVTQVITNTAISSWAGAITSANTTFDTFAHVYLPLTTLNYCSDFFDTFTNPTSGWPIGEDDLVRYGYLNGEYQVFSKSDQYLYLFRSPGCTRQNYVVQMDARWEGTPGSSYGLIFGLNGDFSQYYLFDMNTDFQLFRLLRIDPGGFATIVPVTSSSAINPGTAINHLKATWNNTQVTLEVNGAILGTWADSAVTGFTYAGLMSAPYTGSPTSDARFDNFRITGLPSTALSATSNPATPANGSNVTVTHRSSPLADLAQWAEDSSLQAKGVGR